MEATVVVHATALLGMLLPHLGLKYRRTPPAGELNSTTD